MARGGDSSLPESSAFLDDLIDAVLHCRYAEVDYVNFRGERKRFEIQPLSMAIYDHQIYVIGAATDGTRHPYRLSRIRSVEVGSKTFEYPERALYDPKQLFRDSFGIFISDTNPVMRVRLRIDKKWGIHARTHRWHVSQRVEETPEALFVTLTARACWELKAWILGFGADAVVLEPAELANEVRGTVIQMAANYGGADAAVAQRSGPKRAQPASRRRRTAG